MDRGILFVDDEESLLRALGRELRPWFYARNLVFWAVTSGEEALGFLAARHAEVAAVVCDMRMPGLSGTEVLESIQSSWPHIPTILLSGQAEPVGLSRAVGAGIRAFVPKPWTTDQLTEELEKALEDGRSRTLTRRLEYQLSQTRRAQTVLFRRDTLDPGFVVDLTYRPFEDQVCGGDFYEVVDLGPGRCLVLVGDVAGHGAEAAFITGIVHSFFLHELTETTSPDGLLEGMNRRVFEHLADAGRTIAATALVFDRLAGTVTWANAGGLPLVLVRQGVGTQVHLRGLPLGLAATTEYPAQTVSLLTGDLWALMTDGLVDRGAAGFVAGEDLSKVVAEATGSGRGHPGILEDLVGLFPEGRFGDDLTLVTMELR